MEVTRCPVVAAHLVFFDEASQLEHRPLHCFSLLLHIVAAGLASRAQRLANVAQVAKRDAGLLSYWSLCRCNRREWSALSVGEERHAHGWW